MGFEEEYLRRKGLDKMDQKRREDRSALDFDLSQEEVTNIDTLLLEFKPKEKLSIDDYKKIMGDLGPALYKAIDDNIIDYWIDILNEFKDQDTATAILTRIDMYQRKEKAA